MTFVDKLFTRLLAESDGKVEKLADKLAEDGVKVLPIKYIYAVGHLILEIECYLRDCKLGRRQIAPTLLLAPRNQVPNLSFLSYYTNHLSIVIDDMLCQTLEPLKNDSRLIAPIDHYVMPDHRAAEVYRVFSEWEDRPPLIALSEEHQERGERWLRQQGVPEGAWVALFHARSSGGRPQDVAHAHRNVDIRSYFPAMEMVASKGGWCIRMGDPMMEPIPPKDCVIDYAHHPDRVDWLDVFLCAKARFALASTSGFASMCSVFHTPTAITNLTPASFLPLTFRDLGILQMLSDRSKNRLLSFTEVFSSDLSNANAWTKRAEEWYSAGIRFVPNSSFEILQLANEIFERTNESSTWTPNRQELHEAFRSLWNENAHYAFYSRARLGSDFLKTYEYLLPPRKVT